MVKVRIHLTPSNRQSSHPFAIPLPAGFCGTDTEECQYGQ